MANITITILICFTNTSTTLTHGSHRSSSTLIFTKCSKIKQKGSFLKFLKYQYRISMKKDNFFFNVCHCQKPPPPQIKVGIFQPFIYGWSSQGKIPLFCILKQRKIVVKFFAYRYDI